MTIIGPVLFAALLVVPSWLAQVEDKDVKVIAVVETDVNGQPVPDSLQFFRDVIPNKENIRFTYLNNMRLPDILKTFDATKYDGVLFLPQSLISTGSKASVEFYSGSHRAMEVHIAKSLELSFQQQ
jgi:ABC-2 type transport system permease protein